MYLYAGTCTVKRNLLLVTTLSYHGSLYFDLNYIVMETRRLAAGTPVEETLDGLQRRLVQAEKGASKLSKHLQKYGFKSSTNDGKEMAKVGKVDGSSNTSKSSMFYLPKTLLISI